MGGKSSKQETKQTNEPPSWAKPALERAGQDALKLYDSGVGYNTYTGPTQTDLSAPTLGGMNGILAATGFQGAPVTNQSINSVVPDVNAIMQQILASKQRPNLASQPQQLWEKKEEQRDPYARDVFSGNNGSPVANQLAFRKKKGA